jgi:hypothetical protein
LAVSFAIAAAKSVSTAARPLMQHVVLAIFAIGLRSGRLRLSQMKKTGRCDAPGPEYDGERLVLVLAMGWQVP